VAINLCATSLWAIGSLALNDNYTIQYALKIVMLSK